MNNFNNFWIPQSGEELERLAGILTRNQKEAHELILAHAWFGHFFEGHLGKVAANTSCINGKPALLSDSIVGICYQSGLVRRLQVVETNERRCVVEAERNDQPEGQVQTFTFTWEMAQQMNLIRASWNKQPANMLMKRARAFICRQVFPEAVSGLYTIDEIADFSNVSEEEHEKLVARSLGYEDDLNPTSAPTPTPAPVPTPTPAPVPTPTRQDVKKKVDLVNTNLISRKALYQFETESEFFEICESLRIDRTEINSQLKRHEFNVEKASPKDRESFFYSIIIHDVTRKSLSLPANWQCISDEHKAHVHLGLSTQYPILKNIPIQWYESRINQAPFAESIRLSNELTDFDNEKLIKAIQTHDPDDWSLYEYTVSLYDGV